MAGGFAPSVGSLGCSGHPQPGTLALENALVGAYGPRGAVSAGIYNCRKIAGTDVWSIHAEGRALDLAVSWPPEALGAEVLERLLLAASELGLQRVIYNRWSYSYDYPRGLVYGGDDPHTTHLHIEQSWRGAMALSRLEAAAAFAVEEMEEDSPMVILSRLAAPSDTQRWLLSGGRRIVLHNWTNVQALLDAGAAVIALPDATLARIPQVL